MKNNILIRKIGRTLFFLKNKLYYSLLCNKRGGLISRCLCGIVFRNRGIVGFYGECHIYVYGGFMEAMKGLKKKYVLLGATELGYLVRCFSAQLNRKEVWNSLNVLIYNPGVPERQGAPSLENVLKWIPDSCKRIEVTNAIFMGYMPQHTNHVFRNAGYFTWGDKNLNKILNTRDTNLIEELKRDDYYSTEYVQRHYDRSLERLKRLEKRCTIKIADYIEEHGKKRILFYSVTHPEIEIMVEITRRIISQLGLSDETIKMPYWAKGTLDLKRHGEVVYPSVMKGLGINGETDKRRVYTGNTTSAFYSFNEYIIEYYNMGVAAEELVEKEV